MNLCPHKRAHSITGTVLARCDCGEILFPETQRLCKSQVRRERETDVCQTLFWLFSAIGAWLGRE